MFDNRLKMLRIKKGLNMKQAAQQLGFSYTTYVGYEKDEREPNSEVLSTLADFYGCSTDYLIGRTEQLIPNDSQIENDIDISKYFNIKPVKKIKLPMLGKIACGKPIFADEDHETFVEVDESYGADFCLTAQGDSMTNAGIDSDDTVLIREAPIVENGEIAAVIIDDEATLKRVYYYKGKNKLVLQAENPRYAPLVYINDELDTIRIIGKAVAVIKRLK